MRRCDRCGYSGGGKHDGGCPEFMSDGPAKILAFKDWQEGYKQGRSGKDEPNNASRPYILGFAQGVVALEEVENGFDPNAEAIDSGEFDDVHLDEQFEAGEIGICSRGRK